MGLAHVDHVHREVTFEFFALKFGFRARRPVHFPPGKAGNVLRGAFGAGLKRTVCDPTCQSARKCVSRGTCPYVRIFEPLEGDHPSGLADPPRPFVFRPSPLDGRTFAPGEPFHFDLNVFDVRNPGIEYYEAGFSRFEGAELLGVSSALTSFSLMPEAREVRRVVVRFKTPTELKAESGIASRPEFGILFARIRDRIGTLCRTYGGGALDIDYRAIGERAAAVRMVRCETHRVEAERRSGRTGQTHSIGGFTGEAEYEGELAEFLPYLRAAKWTGVGRQTVWGKGEIEVD